MSNIVLLPMPTRVDNETGASFEDVVGLSDPDGAYFNQGIGLIDKSPLAQVIIKGPIVGSPADYAAAASWKIGHMMRVKESSVLGVDNLSVERARVARSIWFVSIILEPVLTVAAGSP